MRARVGQYTLFEFSLKLRARLFNFLRSGDDASSSILVTVRVSSVNLSMMAPVSDRQEEAGISAKKKEENYNKENLW